MSDKEQEQEVLMDKQYSWESCIDAEEDIASAVENLEPEFKGTVRIVVTYER